MIVLNVHKWLVNNNSDQQPRDKWEHIKTANVAITMEYQDKS